MYINYKALKKLNSKGFFDTCIAATSAGYWCYWIVTEVLPSGSEAVYTSVLSAVFLGAAIGHAVRAYYLNLLLKISINEANRNIRVMRDVRNALTKIRGSHIAELNNKEENNDAK